MKKILTVIIPMRMSPQLYQGAERLTTLLAQIPFDLIDVLIVDYGTPPPYQGWREAINAFPQVQIHQEEQVANTTFSIGHARDLGVQHAKTPVVMFQDIDFICNTVMYQRLHSEIIAREIVAKKAKDFFCIPVAFLTEDASQHYYAETQDTGAVFNAKLQQQLLTDSHQQCDFIAYGSSAIVVNRYNYLSLGGHDRRFSGHGAEDYDILHRLSAQSIKAPRPNDYYLDTKSNLIQRYQGFRAYFALYGIDVFNKGIFISHLWHPKRNIPDYSQHQHNFKLLKKVMISYDKRPWLFPPLPDRTITERTLILSSPKATFVKAIRNALPLMGDVWFKDEKEFKRYDALLAFVKQHQISTLGFKNPYGNPHRLDLYQQVKTAGFPFWVMDRGALVDSWFFDPQGFNAESSSYAQENWDKPLSDKAHVSVRNYIKTAKQSALTLEHNGQRIPQDTLKQQLSLGDKKVLLIPFQRPSDSVCTYFSGAMESAAQFDRSVETLITQLDPEQWVVIGKKHPLEQYNPKVNAIKFVPSELHIHDLLQLADAVYLLNSGVGVLAALFEKPVIYSGDIFYKMKGVNYHAKNSQAVLALLTTDLTVNAETMHRFIYHLIDHVYSFGKTDYRQIKRKEDGATLSLAENIHFREIRGLTKTVIELGNITPPIALNEPLFYSFDKDSLHYNAKKAGLKEPLKKAGLFIIATLLSPFLSTNKVEKLKRDPQAFVTDALRNKVGK